MSTNKAQGEMCCFFMVAIPGLEREVSHSSVEETRAELVKRELVREQETERRRRRRQEEPKALFVWPEEGFWCYMRWWIGATQAGPSFLNV